MPPPLRLSVRVDTPGGKGYRWADDETDAANIPEGLRFSSTMPGGFESFDCTLPRQPRIDYADLERLSNVTVVGAGGETVWDGRLERVPRSSGDEASVSPSAVGHQAALEDDKTVQFLGVDIDQTAWGGMSVQRQLDVGKNPSTGVYTGFAPLDGSSVPDKTTGQPSIQLEATSPWKRQAPLSGQGGWPFVESWFDAKGLAIASMFYAWKRDSVGISTSDPNWFYAPLLCSDDLSTAFDYPGNLVSAAASGLGTVTATGTRKFAAVQFRYGADLEGLIYEGWVWDIWWTALGVYGDHGMVKRGSSTSPTDPQGFFASDIVRHVVPRFAPQLRVTTDSVQDSGFVIPHFSFLEPTTCAELVRQATRVGMQDWGVYEDRVFFWRQPGTGGRKWRARVRPTQLSETGPQVDRLWNGVVVQYQDVDGSTRTVGPPGSGATVISSYLLDSDPENPANKLGIRRWDMLTGLGTADSETAISVGQVFLSQAKLLDSSGQANIVGFCRDDKGVVQPAWKVRAGDQISFVDAADSSYRKVVRADYNHDSRTCSVDLDAPPEGLSVLLERLGVVLVPLGLN